MSPTVIAIELDELAPALLDRFIAAGELPNFARFRRESTVCTTHAEGPLERVHQWSVVHSPSLEEDNSPRLWDILSRQGSTSWICGSLDAAWQQPLRGMVLPDPHGSLPPSHPDLAPYLRFVRARLAGHELSPLDYARFALSMLSHGLSAESVVGLGVQVAEERSHRDARWKRGASLDLLQLDVFRHYYARLRPAFATFFASSTASRPPHVGLDADASLFGYQRLDALLGRLIDLDEASTLVLVSALALVDVRRDGTSVYGPDGILWIRTPARARVAAPPMRLADVASLLLRLVDDPIGRVA